MKENKQKNPAAVELGKLGGRAQAQKLHKKLGGKQEVQQYMKSLIEKRWAKQGPKPNIGLTSRQKPSGMPET